MPDIIDIINNSIINIWEDYVENIRLVVFKSIKGKYPNIKDVIFKKADDTTEVKETSIPIFWIGINEHFEDYIGYIFLTEQGVSYVVKPVFPDIEDLLDEAIEEALNIKEVSHAND